MNSPMRPPTSARISTDGSLLAVSNQVFHFVWWAMFGGGPGAPAARKIASKVLCEPLSTSAMAAQTDIGSRMLECSSPFETNLPTLPAASKAHDICDYTALSRQKCHDDLRRRIVGALASGEQPGYVISNLTLASLRCGRLASLRDFPNCQSALSTLRPSIR